jgi:hypothetical protein
VLEVEALPRAAPASAGGSFESRIRRYGGRAEGIGPGSVQVFTASIGKWSLRCIVPSNQAHHTVGLPKSVPTLVTVIGGPPDFNSTMSPILSVTFASHHGNPQRATITWRDHGGIHELASACERRYSVTGLHQKPSPHRLIRLAEGEGKCAVQHRVSVSQHRSSIPRRVTAACLGSVSARMDISG